MNRREALQRTAAITGLAVSSSISLGLLKGCAPSGKPSWPPIFLKPEEISLVSAVSETILPKSETLGALDVHVPEFIDLMLRDCFSTEEQQSFRDGLNEFVTTVDTAYSDTFEGVSIKDKQTIIEAEEIRSAEQYAGTQKKSFYQLTKELTILGYYTSEYVMKNMLDYHPIPGRQQGCIPFNEGGRLFVDNNV